MNLSLSLHNFPDRGSLHNFPNRGCLMSIWVGGAGIGVASGAGRWRLETGGSGAITHASRRAVKPFLTRPFLTTWRRTRAWDRQQPGPIDEHLLGQLRRVQCSFCSPGRVIRPRASTVKRKGQRSTQLQATCVPAAISSNKKQGMPAQHTFFPGWSADADALPSRAQESPHGATRERAFFLYPSCTYRPAGRTTTRAGGRSQCPAGLDLTHVS